MMSTGATMRTRCSLRTLLPPVGFPLSRNRSRWRIRYRSLLRERVFAPSSTTASRTDSQETCSVRNFFKFQIKKSEKKRVCIVIPYGVVGCFLLSFPIYIYISTERRVFYHHPYFKKPILKSFFFSQKKGKKVKKGNHA